MATNPVTAHRNADKTTRSCGRAVLGRSVLVASLVAALVGSGAVTAAAATKHDNMHEVVRYTMDIGAPGFMARLSDGRRTTVTAAGGTRR